MLANGSKFLIAQMADRIILFARVSFCCEKQHGLISLISQLSD
jgi:hypothetical protein